MPSLGCVSKGRLRADTAHRLHLIRPYGMVANLISNFEHVPVERPP